MNPPAAAFVSAKGGCGATTLACHVAVELPHLVKSKVLLADFDLQSGIIGFLLKSKTPYSIADAAHNLQRLDVSYWKALISNGIPDLEVIRAPVSARDKEISGAHVREILRFAREHYDYSVIDLGRNLTAASLAALEAADEAYLVTTAEVPALHETQQIIRQLLETGYPQSKLHVVLNRLSRRMEISLDEMESMLGLPVFATVVNDYQSLEEAYSQGRLADPSSAAGQSFARLAAKVAGVEPEKKKKFSLFG
jgi:pilus assembly protein CpaE